MGRAELMLAGVLTLACLAGPAVAQTEVCNSDATDIVNLELVTSTIDFADEMQIDDVRVSVEITHAWMGDLVLGVVSAEGTGVTLKNQDYLNDGTADMLLAWSDAGVDHGSDEWTCDCDMAPSGPGALSDMDGENPSGEWILAIGDVVTPDEGTLDSWCVEISACGDVIPVVLSCSVVDSDVTLTWTGTGFEAYSILRNGVEVETVLDTEDFEFTETLDPGSYLYEIAGGDEDDACVSTRHCTVDVGVIEACITVNSTVSFDLDPVISAMNPGNVVTTVEELGASVDITHGFVGDLTVELENPEGTSLLLHDGDGGAQDDLVALYTDFALDNGHASYDCGCHMRAKGPGELVDLEVDPEGGIWTLTVSDGGDNGYTGTVNGWCLRFYGEAEDDDAAEFIRGDCDGTGVLFPILDALFVLEYGFVNGPTPGCLAACDCDGDGVVFPILDALYCLEYGFTDGPEPPAPFMDCGPDTNDPGPGCQTPSDACP